MSDHNNIRQPPLTTQQSTGSESYSPPEKQQQGLAAYLHKKRQIYRQEAIQSQAAFQRLETQLSLEPSSSEQKETIPPLAADVQKEYADAKSKLDDLIERQEEIDRIITRGNQRMEKRSQAKSSSSHPT